MMNKVILCGRFTKEPEVRYSGANNLCIARFTLAVDRRFTQEGGPTADFVGCVALGKTGEFVEKYMKKGIKVILEGRIQTGSYTNKDGQKVYTTDVIAEQLEFAESKKDNTTEQTAQKDNDGFMYIPVGLDESLPFN